MKKNVFLLLLLLACQHIALGQQTNSRNYILSRTYKQAGANANNVGQVAIQVDYFDGLGRPSQQVLVRRSPAGHDLVSTIEYDADGRESKRYLPFANNGNGAFHANAPGGAASWYTANSAGLDPADLGRPFTETFYEASPLDRPAGYRAPGNQSASASIQYKINTASEVKRYDYVFASQSVVQVGHYDAGTLQRIQSQDEAGHETNEYIDLSGQTVLKTVLTGTETLATYYVFDALGLLRAVLQPGFQDNPSFTEQAFVYHYDSRRRMISKNVPGGGITEFVYDNFDRLALSRDANQAARNVWAFVKYDALNRPVATGEISSSATRSSWATTVAAITNHHETRNNGTAAGYSLNQTAPTTATEANLLTLTFYDDHAFQQPANFGYTPPAGYASQNSAVKGQVTGGRTRMLPGAGGTGAWLTHAVYYDAEYRPIQAVRQLHDLGTTAIERHSIKYKYDLAPVAEQETTEQLLSGAVTHTHTKTYTYDHADRLLSVLESVATPDAAKSAYTLAQRYNTLGQLSSKWFHGYTSNPTQYRRRTAYTYNIRGWLTQGDTRYLQMEGMPENPFYAFDLEYADGGSYTNGNISRMRWRDKDIGSYTEGLSFAYDNANRITGSSGLGGYTHTESGITYDKNGNLLSLNRAGFAAENLSYSYSSGNRLSSVNGAGYTYDVNGNMLTDGRRSATITYNYLNLPKTVAVNSKNLVYDYDASGTKHKYSDGTVVTKYAGAFEYNTANVLRRVATAEGQAIPGGDTLAFHYYLKDHLGNVRVVFDEEGEIVQETGYYPFGLAVSRSGTDAINRYLYNGKEKQPETGYLDYGARMYMPEIGRWGVVDSLSEKMFSWSPYTYAFNNPIRFIDIGGMIPYPITIRAFAPFNSFGGGFHGDGNNRGFSRSYAQTARASQIIFFDTDKGKPRTFNWSNKSYHPLAGEDRAMPGGGVSSFSSSVGGNGEKKFEFESSLAAANPLTPKGTPDINIFSNFSIVEDKKKGSLSITGNLTGDNFPSTEAFISDPSGQSAFLGVGFYEGNPYTSLRGENKDNPITQINITISTDKKGNFTGVNFNGQNYSISDWNKLFEKKDPHNKDNNR